MDISTNSVKGNRSDFASHHRPRVLFIEYGIGFGGSVVSLSELVAGLTDLGAVHCIVVTFQARDVTKGLFPTVKEYRIRRLLNYRSRDSVKRISQRWVPIPVLRRIALKLYAIADSAYMYVLAHRLYRIAKVEGVDVLHLNNGPERSGLLAARWLGIQCVTHWRGFARPGLSAHGRPSWIRDLIRCQIGVSEAVSDSLRLAGYAPERIRTIYNPVSPERYRITTSERTALRERWGIPKDGVVASIFGRITEWKGQLEFLLAGERIVALCPHLILMIVGDESDGGKDYMEAVRAVAARPSLTNRVTFTGYQNGVASYYALSDIVVHNSNEPEPFGRVVVEGMASRRAVIAMDEGGPREIITNGLDGLLVPPRNTPLLAAALLRLYTDEGLRERLAENALDTVTRRFLSRSIAAQVATCYE